MSNACKSIFTVILFLASALSFAQIKQTGRFEIPLAPDEYDSYKAISVDSSGIIVFRRLIGKTNDQIEVIRLDSALKVTWKGYMAIEKSLVYYLSGSYQNSVYMIFRGPSGSATSFLAISLNADDGKYRSYFIRNLIPFNPTDFTVTNESILLSGYFNFRPLVLHYAFDTQKSKILPGFFNEPGELTQMKTYDDGSIDIVVSAKNYERKKCLWIRNYDSKGDLIKTTVLAGEENKNLLFGRSLKMPGDQQVVAGVYGRNSEYSRGIFVASINPYGEYTIRYYNFGELQNFFHYMRVKQERRVKERIERRKIKGKRIKFNYRFLVNELIPYGDQYIMLGEAFYPHYAYRSRSYGPVNGFGNYNTAGYGYASNRGDLVFDGYQYTHAVAIGFDQNGKLLWDNSFEINDAKSFKLEQFVKIAPREDHIGLLYVFENGIRTKVIRESEVIEGKTTNPTITLSEDEVVYKEDTRDSHLNYWYGNHFFVSGVQNVKKAKDKRYQSGRKVFFINKITY